MSKIKLSFFRCLAGVFFLALWMIPGRTMAQDGLSIDTFRISSGPDALYDLVLPKPKPHLKWFVGGLLNHAQEPVFRKIRRPSATEEDYPVKYRVSLDLYGAIGISDVVELGLAVPVVIFQDGEGTVAGRELQHAGLGDPRIDVKGLLLDRRVVQLGVAGTLTLPAGHYASNGTDFMGARLPTFEPKVLGSARLGRAVLAVNAGFLIRARESIGDTIQTHAVTWNAGVSWDIKDFQEKNGSQIALETNGEVGIDFDIFQMPIETILGVKYRTETDVIVTVGGGPGLSRGLGTPIFRFFVGVAYDKVQRNCPSGPEDVDGFEDNDRCIDPDNDGDGILDTFDHCPNQAEDKDDFQDDDGCPDDDNDKDTIPDAVDKCPMIPEDTDQFEDDDGCPEEGPGGPMVTITDTQLLISSKIYFDYNKYAIKEVSYPILDAVAEALMTNLHIKRVQIDGHTDNEGTEEYNNTLSTNRAKAVMDYLIDKGVDAERLTYKGFGFSRPKASNDTEEGKAINRRVEFTILRGETQ